MINKKYRVAAALCFLLVVTLGCGTNGQLLFQNLLEDTIDNAIAQVNGAAGQFVTQVSTQLAEDLAENLDTNPLGPDGLPSANFVDGLQDVILAAGSQNREICIVLSKPVEAPSGGELLLEDGGKDIIIEMTVSGTKVSVRDAPLAENSPSGLGCFAEVVLADPMRKVDSAKLRLRLSGDKEFTLPVSGTLMFSLPNQGSP